MYKESFFKKLLYKFAMVLPDKLYLSLKYRIKFGKNINWKQPQTFNEKLQWLKVYNRNPLYTIMVDKYAVKQYVANIIGEEHVIPTLGAWDKAEDIDFDSLPNQFVLKATHDSGRVLICRDKSKFNREKAIAEMKISLKRNFYAVSREWPYKNVPRRIIAEKFMEENEQALHVNDKTEELKDYKFFCFNGEPKYCQVISDRNTDEKIDFYDMNWKRLLGLLGLSDDIRNSEIDAPCPYSFDEMKRMAKMLAKDIPFSRIDFYEINRKAYFGEITFYPASGFGVFRPDEWNLKMGNLINI